MPVSRALKKLSSDFSIKYSCKFDFAAFESMVKEFTFLRPVNGWSDAYKMMFEQMYKQALESVATVSDTKLDGEEMIDDFEYMLIRPYVNKSKTELQHKHYVGMDRVTRLAYLNQLTMKAPKNLVELYAEKYKSGAFNLGTMSATLLENAEREKHIEFAGYVKAIEDVNKGRSLLWRTLHPFKNHDEKKRAAFMKKMLVDKVGGEKSYGEIVTEAYETFAGHQIVSARLEQSIVHAKEEMNRQEKMHEAIRESLRIEEFEKASGRELSPKAEKYNISQKEKQV